ncbi:MAG TPA: DUF1569 domain-containing protein [Gemmataceae bacterium]|nr:DUF1569 domain-containing protein [Gemmataceae bacterium]
MSPQTNPTAAGPIDTAKVADRRPLHFETIDQMMAEVDRLAEAERAGRLGHLGNWTLGQTLGHLATWAEYAYTPAPIKPPFFIRWFLRLRKRSFLYGKMRAGVKIPGVQGGTLGAEPMDLDQALGRLRRVMERLKVEAPTVPSAAIGPLTHAEGIALNMRHAELHLGFHVPEPAPAGTTGS